MVKKAKDSANYEKLEYRVTKCQEKVANARADFQHKLSPTLVDENQAVIVKALKSAYYEKPQTCNLMA